MLKKLDGLWLNSNHISSVIVHESTSANDPHYNIQFTMGPETAYGSSRFTSERDCQRDIDKMMGEL